MSSLASRREDMGGSERRRAGRVLCAQTTCQFGPVSDFSRTGVKVLSKRPLKVPTDKSVNMEIQTAGAKLVIPARVVNNRKRRDGLYETGFAFVGIDERWNEALATMARIASSDAGRPHLLKFIS